MKSRTNHIIMLMQNYSNRYIRRLYNCITWNSIIIPLLYNVCQSIYPYIAGNPRDTKSCHLITHVNLIASN